MSDGGTGGVSHLCPRRGNAIPSGSPNLKASKIHQSTSFAKGITRRFVLQMRARHLRSAVRPRPLRGVRRGSPCRALLPPVVLEGGPIHRRGSCHPPTRDGVYRKAGSRGGRSRDPLSDGKAKIHSSAGYGLCVQFAPLLSTQSPPADAVGLPGGYPLDPALAHRSWRESEKSLNHGQYVVRAMR